MEKTVNNVEQTVKIKRIANVDEGGVINLEMTDGSTFGVCFDHESEIVHTFPPKGVQIVRPLFEHDAGPVVGFAIRKAVEQ